MKQDHKRGIEIGVYGLKRRRTLINPWVAVMLALIALSALWAAMTILPMLDLHIGLFRQG